MKRFLLRATGFLILAALPFLAAELLVREVPNDYSYKREQITRHADSVEVLILGSSHTLFGLNPEYFSAPAFNFAFTSQPLKFDRYIFERYVEQLPQLRTVVLPIAFFSLDYELEDSIEAWRKQRYVHYLGYWEQLDLREKLQMKTYSVIFQNDVARLYHATRHYLEKGEGQVTVNALGWSTLFSDGRATDLETTGPQAAKRHNEVPQHDSPKTDLERILRLAEARGVEVVLFTPPAWRSYRQQVDARRIEAMHHHIAGLQQRYTNLRYLDLFADERFDRDDFHDADHMNHRGAKKLSCIVDTFIGHPSTLVRGNASTNPLHSDTAAAPDNVLPPRPGA